MVTIGKSLIDKFKVWSTFPFSKSENVDRMLVEALILSSVGLKFLEEGNEVDECVMDFVKSKLYSFILTQSVI